MDQDEFSVTATPHGVLFSRFMVRFESMKALMSVSETHGTRSVSIYQEEKLHHFSLRGIRHHQCSRVLQYEWRQFRVKSGAVYGCCRFTLSDS